MRGYRIMKTSTPQPVLPDGIVPNRTNRVAQEPEVLQHRVFGLSASQVGVTRRNREKSHGRKKQKQAAGLRSGDGGWRK